MFIIPWDFKLKPESLPWSLTCSENLQNNCVKNTSVETVFNTLPSHSHLLVFGLFHLLGLLLHQVFFSLGPEKYSLEDYIHVFLDKWILLFYRPYPLRTGDSSVSVVTRVWAGWSRVCGVIPAQACKFFSPLGNAETGSWAYPVSYSMDSTGKVVRLQSCKLTIT